MQENQSHQQWLSPVCHNNQYLNRAGLHQKCENSRSLCFVKKIRMIFLVSKKNKKITKSKIHDYVDIIEVLNNEGQVTNPQLEFAIDKYRLH
jgi:hypothetical protein